MVAVQMFLSRLSGDIIHLTKNLNDTHVVTHFLGLDICNFIQNRKQDLSNIEKKPHKHYLNLRGLFCSWPYCYF